MALNLLSEKAFNDYLTDIVYQGVSVPKQQSYNGEFESPDYVEQHRDEIIKGILNQYVKLRLRQYVLTLENEPAFELVDKNRADLPGWTVQTFARGENIYEFNGVKMSQKLRDDITMIRDFLYDEAGMYVDKTTRIARETKKKPKIRYDYLKTKNEYDTFEKALAAAQQWHDNMAAELEKRNKARDLLKKSLVGVKHVMDLSDGMSVYQLTTSEALDFESEYMGHCVGRGSYDNGVKKGTIQIYSIRDEHGEPHATFEVRNGKIYQCKGKADKRPIAKYIPIIQEFISRQGLQIAAEEANMGYVLVDGKYLSINNLPKEKEVKGDVNFRNMDLYELPDLSGWVVHGNFICAVNHLTSLKGAPKIVDGDFVCNGNELINLVGSPQQVGGNFDCSDNDLISLEGAPKNIGAGFNCAYNGLTNFVGGPAKINGQFNCVGNPLAGLDGIPQGISDFVCDEPLYQEWKKVKVSVNTDKVTVFKQGTIMLKTMFSQKLHTHDYE